MRGKTKKGKKDMLKSDYNKVQEAIEKSIIKCRPVRRRTYYETEHQSGREYFVIEISDELEPTISNLIDEVERVSNELDLTIEPKMYSSQIHLALEMQEIVQAYQNDTTLNHHESAIDYNKKTLVYKFFYCDCKECGLKKDNKKTHFDYTYRKKENSFGKRVKNDKL